MNQLVATTEMVRGGAIDDLFDTPTSAVRGGNNIKSKPPHAVVHMGPGSTTIQYQSAGSLNHNHSMPTSISEAGPAKTLPILTETLKHDGDVTKLWNSCATRHLAKWKPCLGKTNDTACNNVLYSSTPDYALHHCYAERFEDAQKIRDSIPVEDVAGRTKALREHFVKVGAPDGHNPLCSRDIVYNLPEYLPNFGGQGMLAVWIDNVLVYTENHKAGSTTIRKKLKDHLNTTWKTWQEHPYLAERFRSIDKCIQGDTTTTTFCVGPKEMDRAVKFTTVRNPLEKFISGYHQLKSDTTTYINETVSLVDATSYIHMNAHLRSNMFHLGLTAGEGRPVLFDKVFHLEAMDKQWPQLVASLPNIGADKKSAMMPNTIMNARGGREMVVQSITETFGGDRDAINRFCHEFGWDYFCLGYDMPEECRDASLWQQTPI